MKINRQTAVEWLSQKLNNKAELSEFEKEAFNIAKEIEKEQVMISYNQGCIDTLKEEMRLSEQYYNETFNK